jgi:hypothetical protein
MSRHSTRVHLAVSALVFALAASAAGAQPTVDRYRIQREFAQASFNYPDSSGCLLTFVSVSVTESAQRIEPGKPEPRAMGFVSLVRIDICHQNQVLFVAQGERELQPDELQFGVNLGSAALHSVFDLFESVTATRHTATVDLTWTATSPATHIQSRYSDSGPGFRHAFREVGSRRTADAVGSVLYDSTELVSGPSVNTYIVNVRDGQLSIDRD